MFMKENALNFNTKYRVCAIISVEELSSEEGILAASLGQISHDNIITRTR